MEKDPYKILEISEHNIQDGRKPEDIDFDIKMKLKRKLDELHEKINKKLNDKELKSYEKISGVDTLIQEMFSYMFAYMKIMTQQTRASYQNGTLSSIEDDLRNMQENLRKMTKIEHRRSKDGNKIPCNAYQVLGIPEGDNELTDKKVEIKTLTLLNMKISKTPPDNLDEITDMLFVVQRGIWAYSKLNTPVNRRNYRYEINCQRLSQDSRKYDSGVGTVRREAKQRAISVPLKQTEDGDTTVSFAEIGKLINRSILIDEDTVNQYLVEKNVNGVKTRSAFYSKIDMRRLQTDDKYAEFVRSILSDNAIDLAKKYLGGYVGEIQTKIVQVEGRQEEILIHRHNPKSIAICKKFQREERKKRESKNISNLTPSKDGGR